jgi:OmcA/MtrC family decaheme c-type cytochrome
MAVMIPVLALAAGCGEDGTQGEQGEQGEQGPPGPQGPPGDIDNGTSVEACIGCHGPDGAVPVVSITDPDDAHYVDTDPLGPATLSGYRQLSVAISSVDVTGSSVIIDFTVTDELGGTVTDIFAGDGRFTIARLMPGAIPQDSNLYDSLIFRLSTGAPGTPGDGNQATQADSERFTTSGGLFQYLGAGEYRYTSNFDPSSAPVVSGATYRVAIQLSAGDLPAGNGWCDFDANLVLANDCSSPVSNTRDIVQTATCNGCHGVTSDTKLALHGGGRTDVEYCVTCHNPGSTDPDSGNTVDFKVMIHKIHYGSNLTNLPYIIYGFRGSQHDYSNVQYTKDIDDCTNCHTDGGLDETNWATVPTREACGSCHDDVDFDTGENHGSGGIQADNSLCTLCHPADSGFKPVSVVHQGVARAAEGDLYAGGGNGFTIENVTPGPGSNDVTIDYSITKQGVGLMDLASAPEWTAGGGASRLAITVGWDTSDYTNEGTSSTPASPPSINALDVGGVVTDNLDGTYTIVASLPSSASNTVTASIEGHPAADLDGDGTYSDRIAVRNTFASVDIEGGRASTLPRRDVVDVANCNQCHDAAGQGISLHGNNRTSEVQVCVVCHNANNTDINRRPADPSTTPDGKVEESIDFKRMIHQIHSGSELENGVVIYGFGNSVHDFSTVDFIGNRQNCETCHEANTYGAENAWDTLPSTISTGADVGDPGDDLNISPTAAVCSSCHDDTVATDHMKLNGASFKALDDDIL